MLFLVISVVINNRHLPVGQVSTVSHYTEKLNGGDFQRIIMIDCFVSFPYLLCYVYVINIISVGIFVPGVITFKKTHKMFPYTF